MGDRETAELVQRSSALRAKGLHQQALALARRACDQDKYNAFAWLELGLAAEALNYKQEAAAAFFHSGDAHARAGEHHAALDLLARTLELDPGHRGAAKLAEMLRRRMPGTSLAEGTANGRDSMPLTPATAEVAVPSTPRIARGSSATNPQARAPSVDDAEATPPETSDYTRAVAVANAALSNPILSKFRSDRLAALAEHAVLSNTEPGQVIESNGGVVYFVIEGELDVENRDGQRWRSRPGDLVAGDQLVGLPSSLTRMTTTVASKLMGLPVHELRYLSEIDSSARDVIWAAVQEHRRHRLVNNHVALADCADQVKQDLIDAGELTDVEPGAALFEQGEDCPGLFLIVTGEFEAVVHSLADTRLDSQKRPGDFIGVAELLSGALMPTRVVSNGQGCVMRIARDQVTRLFAVHPLLLEAMSRLA